MEHSVIAGCNPKDVTRGSPCYGICLWERGGYRRAPEREVSRLFFFVGWDLPPLQRGAAAGPGGGGPLEGGGRAGEEFRVCPDPEAVRGDRDFRENADFP